MDKCLVCKEGAKITKMIKFDPDVHLVECQRCGKYKFYASVSNYLFDPKLSPRQRANISGWLREFPGHKISSTNVNQLLSIRTPSFHERADKLLLAFEKSTQFAGHLLSWDNSWISHGWCINEEECREILDYLHIFERIDYHVDTLKIKYEGWAHLEELKKSNPNSNQCFVAMWFSDEMNDVYKSTIKPAIEFVEPDEKEPRYKALKINDEEHINDINDEIVAQIRRSRFMVCDLTGYRGGVYFEAGFAKGLGLDVIYTCRKDWTKEEVLTDSEGKEVKVLLDGNKKEIEVKKEGVHFDLDHMFRIEWEPTSDGLKEFKTKLENRIKAVIT